MVARLKLKEIDGRAPPGVNTAEALPPKAAGKPVSGALGQRPKHASRRGGNTLKMRESPKTN